MLAMFLLLAAGTYAQCATDESLVQVSITTDTYPGETIWTLSDASGNVVLSGGPYASPSTLYTATACVPSSACLTFQIIDTFGDGIYAPGGYSLSVNAVQVSAGSVSGSGLTQHFNCPEGTYCSNATSIPGDGTYTAQYDNTWFVYNSTETGTYTISTCGTATCDTRVYVYANCYQEYMDEGPPGTYAYNDDGMTCAPQAELNVILEANRTYYIRIGDAADNCPDPITFNFSYTGQVSGCTDPSACNFAPLAQQDDGSCVYFPNAICTGPDLQFDYNDFVNSLYLMPHTTANCDIEEGCVLGYGQRYVLAFSSKIDNIGDQDYYIGNPSANPQMFDTQNCHGHTHYNAYGDYRLYDMQGNLIPAGHKNGFCVMDLCGGGQYNCGNMGISANCYDVYGAGTQCQWVDLTDIPTGDYRLVIIVNPFHLPDALGRYETNHENNASQICIHIEHNEGGAPTWYPLAECPTYVDCMGTVGGSAVLDCNGDCNGAALWGNVVDDAALDHNDTEMYINMIAHMGSEATNCNDLSGNGDLSIYDIALMQWCGHSAPVMGPGGVMHQICSFPRDVVNPDQMAGVAITDINLDEQYLDIELMSPDANILGYQFGMSGITVSGVESLVDPLEYPAVIDFNAQNNEIICISAQDSIIDRQTAARPLVRVHYSSITSSMICIDPVIDIVNKNGERTTSYIYGNCASSVGVNTLAGAMDAHMVLQPNPVTNSARVRFVGENADRGTLIIRDDIGRMVKQVRISATSDKTMEIDFSDLSHGVYTLTLQNDLHTAETLRFVKL